MKRIVIEIVLAFAIVTAVTTVVGDVMRSAYLKRLRGQITPDAEVVLIGNSMLGRGVDANALSQALGMRSSTVWSGGAASAWWYVVLKNHVLTLEPRPRAVVIVFRDSFLTQPAYRLTGRDASNIRYLSVSDEPTLDALAWEPTLGLLQHQLIKRIPALRQRHQFQQLFDAHLNRDPAALLTGRSSAEVKASVKTVFHGSRMLAREVTRAQLRAEATDEVSHFAFATRLERSLLPHMANAAREAGITLILVRIRRRAHTQGPDAEALHTYLADLGAWAQVHEIPLIDFGSESRLRLEHFAAGDHLGPEGRALFTRLLAERLRPLLR